MKATFRTPLVAVLGLLAFGCDNPNESSDNNVPDSNNQITLDADDIGGVVESSGGPELQTSPRTWSEADSARSPGWAMVLTRSFQRSGPPKRSKSW